MNKPYLLIAGDNYYPDAKTGDWKGCYSTFEEAEAEVSEYKNVLGTQDGYLFNEQVYDWYTIVDLRDWTNA